MNDPILWTASVTPFTAKGDIDYDEMRLLADRQDKAGNGFLIIGSTGEGLALTTEEKKELVRFVSGLGLKVPVMVGVGGFNLGDQIEWIEYCNDYDIHSFLLVTPLYAKPGMLGQAHWFQQLMDHANKPCMIYNVPSRTGVALHPGALKKVAGHKRLMGVKEASGSIDKFREFYLTCPNVDLYSGDDGMMPYLGVAGANGLVSVISNIWPEATHKYVEKCIDGKGKECLPVWQQASKALFIASNPIPAKVYLKHKQIIKTAVLRPPLTEEDLHDIKPLIEADEAVSAWMSEQ